MGRLCETQLIWQLSRSNVERKEETATYESWTLFCFRYSWLLKKKMFHDKKNIVRNCETLY